jgi:hypothetical protein
MTELGPLEYEIEDKSLNEGKQWLTVKVENISDQNISGLSVELHSLNSYNLDVIGSDEYVPVLRPNEETFLVFQVRARMSSDVYLVFEGSTDGASFTWQSPYTYIMVGAPVAEIQSFFVMTEPYPYLVKDLNAEAVVRGNTFSTELSISFWVSTPDGSYVKMAEENVASLDKGEIETISADYITGQEGMHRFYAYLYDGENLIDSDTDRVYVTQE